MVIYGRFHTLSRPCRVCVASVQVHTFRHVSVTHCVYTIPFTRARHNEFFLSFHFACSTSTRNYYGCSLLFKSNFFYLYPLPQSFITTTNRPRQQITPDNGHKYHETVRKPCTCETSIIRVNGCRVHGNRVCV